MKHALTMALAALILPLAACTGNLSSRAVRQQIAELGTATLNVDDIQVQRIVTELGDRAIAEANVRLVFQFEKDAEGEWTIVAARLGDREWIDIEDLFAAMAQQNTGDTSSSLEKLSAGLDEYRSRNGSLPEVPAEGFVSDVLHPLFMTELIRDDAWGARISYHAEGANYELRSPGPDGVIGNTDDIVRNVTPQ
jgi:hypothetical protein